MCVCVCVYGVDVLLLYVLWWSFPRTIGVKDFAMGVNQLEVGITLNFLYFLFSPLLNLRHRVVERSFFYTIYLKDIFMVLRL